jgi:hypothetical protein
LREQLDQPDGSMCKVPIGFPGSQSWVHSTLQAHQVRDRDVFSHDYS